LLARHELYVAGYYLNRDRPEATIARIQTLLEQYEGSGVEPEALLLMGRTYLHMRQPREARLAFGELVDRFPRTGFRVQACNYLERMGTDCGDAPSDRGELLEGDPLEGAPRRDGDGTPALSPGTDIDDVTDGDDPTQREIDTYEDTSEAGIDVRSDGVDAADLEEGRTADGYEEEIEEEAIEDVLEEE
jgi:outer membrane protein assembly factor BamD